MHNTKNLTVSGPAHPGPQSLDRAPAHSSVRRPTIARRTAPPRVGTAPLFHAALSEPDVASVVKPSSTRENSNVKLVPHSISQLPRRKSVAHVALVHPVAIGAPIPPRALLLECARDADRCAAAAEARARDPDGVLATLSAHDLVADFADLDRGFVLSPWRRARSAAIEVSSRASRTYKGERMIRWRYCCCNESTIS